MANIKSAKKRNIQNEKRRVRNTAVRSSVRTATKKILSSIASTGENIGELHQMYIKTIDKASSKGIIHWKKAARKKSRIARKVNAVQKQKATS